MDPNHTLLTAAFLISLGAYASGHLLRRSWKHAVFGMLAAPLVMIALGVTAGSFAVFLLKGAVTESSALNAIGLGTSLFTAFGLFGLFVSHEFGERNGTPVRFSPKLLTRPRRWRRLPVRFSRQGAVSSHHDTPQSPFRSRRLITDFTRSSIPGATQHQSLRLESPSDHARSIGR